MSRRFALRSFDWDTIMTLITENKRSSYWQPFVTGCTRGCQNDNLGCSQWREGCQYDDLLVSVMTMIGNDGKGDDDNDHEFSTSTIMIMIMITPFRPYLTTWNEWLTHEGLGYHNTHLPLMPYICHNASVHWISIASDNGLRLIGAKSLSESILHGILLIQTLGTNVSEIISEIRTFSRKCIWMKMSSARN